MEDRDIVTIFARCSRLLSRISLEAKDEFLSKLYSREADKLLSAFVEFLKTKGETAAGTGTAIQAHPDQTPPETLRQAAVVRFGDIADPKKHVAQSRVRLIFQIKNILNLAEILKYLDFLKPSTPLFLEKNLLLLELVVLNHFNGGENAKAGIDNGLPLQDNNPHNKTGLSTDKLGRVHLEILKLLRSNGRTQNSEIFSRLNGTSRRTLKRKLSELALLRLIKRFSEGKKVFYAAAAGPAPVIQDPAKIDK